MTQANKILPEEPDAAVQKMIDLAQECLNLAQNEGKTIEADSALHFVVNEQHKTKAFQFYEQAAKEFSERINEMQGKVNQALITDLQRLQLDLRDQAQWNNDQLAEIDGIAQRND